MDATAAIPESALPIVTKTIKSMSVLRNKIEALKQNGTLKGKKAVKASRLYAGFHNEMTACINSIKSGTGDLEKEKHALGMVRVFAEVYVRVITQA